MLLKSIKIPLFLAIVSIVFSSCTLGFFISKDQKVNIEKDSLTTILINKKEPVVQEKLYLLPRDGVAQQVEMKRDGYKSKYKVFFPYKFSAAGIATIAFNAAVAGTASALLLAAEISEPIGVIFSSSLTSIMGAIWGGFYVSIDPKFWNYENTIHLNDSLIRIPTKDSLTKEIRLNKVAIDISPENSEDYNVSYSDYKKGRLKLKVNTKTEKGIKNDDSYLSEELNSILKKNGFIDTSGLALKTNYNQNAFVNATILGYKYVWVPNISKVTGDDRKTGFVNIELKVKWDVLDYYKKLVYSDTIRSKSGEFVSFVSDANSNYKKDVFKDAMETGLYSLMNSTKFKGFMKFERIVNTDTLKPMEIKCAKSCVSSIEQAVEASVTIKTKDGHGSGFLISDDGYIITNYHVISDSAKLEVILHDGTKIPTRIIRYNKEADMALLKIEKKNFVPFMIPEAETAVIGREIYVIGTPSAQDLSQTLTKGIISSVRKQSNGSKVIQADASISPGNSGGPLIDKDGKLLGVVNAKLVGMGVEGISFAMPVNEITKALMLKLK